MNRQGFFFAILRRADGTGGANAEAKTLKDIILLLTIQYFETIRLLQVHVYKSKFGIFKNLDNELVVEIHIWLSINFDSFDSIWPKIFLSIKRR